MGDIAFPRKASLVACSPMVTVESMSAVAGVAPDRACCKGQVRPEAIVPIPAKEHSWEILEVGEREVPLEVLIDRLFVRAFRMRESFTALREAGCDIVLSLMQWMSDSDPHGPGFALDVEVLHFLAEIGALVDVDLYVD
jgi:hypothetical protein